MTSRPLGTSNNLFPGRVKLSPSFTSPRGVSICPSRSFTVEISPLFITNICSSSPLSITYHSIVDNTGIRRRRGSYESFKQCSDEKHSVTLTLHRKDAIRTLNRSNPSSLSGSMNPSRPSPIFFVWVFFRSVWRTEISNLVLISTVVAEEREWY